MGLLIAFFILAVFSERWFLSTVAFAPCFGFYMYKTGDDLFGFEFEWKELIMRSVFAVAIYAGVAYRVEYHKKQAFMGRESPEKAFHRWMKIFETFPEGIALIRGGSLLYANRALKQILDVGLDRTRGDDPALDALRAELREATV